MPISFPIGSVGFKFAIAGTVANARAGWLESPKRASGSFDRSVQCGGAGVEGTCRVAKGLVQA